RSSQEVKLSVHLHARLTELGTLELECVARGTGNEADRWKLAFDLRAIDAPGPEPSAAAPRPEDAADPAALARAIALLRGLYGKDASSSEPTGVMKSLQGILGAKD